MFEFVRFNSIFEDFLSSKCDFRSDFDSFLSSFREVLSSFSSLVIDKRRFPVFVLELDFDSIVFSSNFERFLRVFFDDNFESKSFRKLLSFLVCFFKDSVNNFGFRALLVKSKNVDKDVLNFINNQRGNFHLIFGQGGLNKVNRFYIESSKVDYVLDPQSSIFRLRVDFLHHFNSGLNHVLCGIAKSRDIGVFLSLNFFEWKNDYFVARELGRVCQNVKLAKKYRLDLSVSFLIPDFSSFKSSIELNSIYKVLGCGNFLNLSFEKFYGLDLSAVVIDDFKLLYDFLLRFERFPSVYEFCDFFRISEKDFFNFLNYSYGVNSIFWRVVRNILSNRGLYVSKGILRVK